MKARKNQFSYGYIIVIITFFIMVVIWGTTYTFGIFFKPLLTEFGWTRATTAGAYSLNALMIGLSTIVAGRLNDKLGPRLIMTVSGLFLGIGYLLMSQIGTRWQLYLFFGVIIGIGMSGSFVPLVSTIARWFTKRRGLMMGIVVSGIGVGTLIIPPVAGWLITTYGWRTSYIIIGATALPLIIIAAQFLRQHPEQIGQLPYDADEMKIENPDSQIRGLSLQQAIRTRQFWLLFTAWFCFSFNLDTIIVHIVPNATDLNIPPSSAVNILAIIGGSSIAGRLGLGGVADRIGVKRAFIISLTLMSIGSFWLLIAKKLWMLYLFAIVWGIGYGGTVALLSPMIGWLFGLRSHGAIMGVAHFGASSGTVIGPSLSGFIFDLSNNYQIAFLVCAILSVIAVILSMLLQQAFSQRR